MRVQNVLTGMPEHWSQPLPKGWIGIARDSRTGHYWCWWPGVVLPVLPACVGCMGLMTDFSLINPCRASEVRHDR